MPCPPKWLIARRAGLVESAAPAARAATAATSPPVHRRVPARSLRPPAGGHRLAGWHGLHRPRSGAGDQKDSGAARGERPHSEGGGASVPRGGLGGVVDAGRKRDMDSPGAWGQPVRHLHGRWAVHPVPADQAGPRRSGTRAQRIPRLRAGAASGAHAGGCAGAAGKKRGDRTGAKASGLAGPRQRGACARYRRSWRHTRERHALLRGPPRPAPRTRRRISDIPLHVGIAWSNAPPTRQGPGGQTHAMAGWRPSVSDHQRRRGPRGDER